jgi:hypothetical protein
MRVVVDLKNRRKTKEKDIPAERGVSTETKKMTVDELALALKTKSVLVDADITAARAAMKDA